MNQPTNLTTSLMLFVTTRTPLLCSPSSTCVMMKHHTHSMGGVRLAQAQLALFLGSLELLVEGNHVSYQTPIKFDQEVAHIVTSFIQNTSTARVQMKSNLCGKSHSPCFIQTVSKHEVSSVKSDMSPVIISFLVMMLSIICVNKGLAWQWLDFRRMSQKSTCVSWRQLWQKEVALHVGCIQSFVWSAIRMEP